MMKFDSKSMVIIGLVLALLFILFGPATKKSSYMYAPPNVGGQEYAPANLAGTNINLQTTCASQAGVGLASSLLPRAIATQDDFGQFAPDDVLAGQNFLDPRSCWRDPQKRQPAGARRAPQPQAGVRLEQLHHCPRSHAAQSVHVNDTSGSQTHLQIQTNQPF
jgi:hypothetical protein